TSPGLDRFEQIAARIAFQAPRVAWFRGMTGMSMELAPDAGYWRRQSYSTTRFSDELQALQQSGCRIFVERGPGEELTSLATEVLGHDSLLLPSIKAGVDGWRSLSEVVSRLFVAGVNVDWRGVHDGAVRRRVSGLPRYPFRRQRYWRG